MKYLFCRIYSKVIFLFHNWHQKILFYPYKKRLKHLGMNYNIEYPLNILGEENISIGDNFIMRKYGKLFAHSNFEGYSYSSSIMIGDNVYFGTNCNISTINNISIGKNVTLASNITIIDHAHGLTDYSDIDIPIMKRELSSKGPIIIEDNVWIGEGAVILGNVTIGKNSIVGANAVVTKSVPPNSIIGGIPAKIIKEIK